ncbi:apoptosis-linked protein [Coprinopsis sp. MPI-PUGE-AT-0042]|nr:apoptosis-linked protein [Coprinopsis sp. MPI-PUGE-AT-0042]
MSINYGHYGGPQRHSSQYGRPPPPPQHHHHPPYGSGHYQPPPPPGADPQLWQYFTAVDADRSGSISVAELQQALVNGDWSRFDLDTVKMLMTIFDSDRSGTINFTEFSGLWKYISDWQNVFRHFDRDRSGSIEGHELSEALRSFGYNLSNALLTLIEHKYASAPASSYGPPPGITFDRFVRACVAVKNLTEAFQRVDSDRDGWVQINYEQFMSIVLSSP